MRLIDADKAIEAIEEVKKIMCENKKLSTNRSRDLAYFVNGLNQACITIDQLAYDTNIILKNELNSKYGINTRL